MTTFMIRVAEIVGADVDEVDLPMPATRFSERIATGTGADRQVALRAYTEQLVSEANAVLAGRVEQLSLVDETLPSELAFSVAYCGRRARISTTFEDGTARGRLVGDGFEAEVPVELEGPDALPDLLVRLLLGSGVQQHPASL